MWGSVGSGGTVHWRFFSKNHSQGLGLMSLLLGIYFTSPSHICWRWNIPNNWVMWNIGTFTNPWFRTSGPVFKASWTLPWMRPAQLSNWGHEFLPLQFPGYNSFPVHPMKQQHPFVAYDQPWDLGLPGDFPSFLASSGAAHQGTSWQGQCGDGGDPGGRTGSGREANGAEPKDRLGHAMGRGLWLWAAKCHWQHFNQTYLYAFHGFTW